MLMDSFSAVCENARMPQVSWSKTHLDEIAARVRVIRAAYGPTAVAIAARVGISAQGWNHYEKGRSPPSNPVLAKLKTLHGITRDWVMDGSWVGVPPETREMLERCEDPGTRTNKKRIISKISA